ncbi:MAG: alanine--tRNA ligase [Gammaproteobacteria bacterium]|nr:alanine--tRNA ligase [Gammaproteobacteria bacterium]
MKTTELRQAFLDFFSQRGHRVVSSSSLVPADDPTLLFTNAGMNQFKDVFLGAEQRDYKRAVTAQRVVRAGGKHNDLDNVGYTARHHTFFEMMGNFSFGDYFKAEAIAYAWEFFTKVLKIDRERLWVTVYKDDQDAENIWLQDIKIDPERVVRMDEKSNFWMMGDTGPCGPCTEIFYDHGPEVPGGPPGTAEEDGDRFVEIWNIVFMQYERTADGKQTALPSPSVDTGMGLERVAAVMQGVTSNYDTDAFQALISAAAQLTGCKDRSNDSLKVIADHIRSCSYLIADGVMPSNEGRGYVLRRIIRRAIRHGYKLGQHGTFFYQLVGPLYELMGDVYPELGRRLHAIEATIEEEEQRFSETLDRGMSLLERAIAKSDDNVIAGDAVFALYDTFGFPVDLTADIARERGLKIDLTGYEKAMEQQRQRAREAGGFKHDYTKQLKVDGKTEFTGYETLDDSGKVIALFREERSVEKLLTGESGVVVLDKTPFYAEGGGQVGDQGTLTDSNNLHFEVIDTQKIGNAFGHFGAVKTDQIQLGQTVQAAVNASMRNATVLNHSATHLVHAALREVLGEHVMQKGSLVGPEYLRFDFSHPRAITGAQLSAVENSVNEQIRANVAAESKTMPYKQAIDAGALAFFGDKYGDEVRVMRFGEFSTELCGGTHVDRVGDIGLFKITEESSIAAGVRRIIAVTGAGAMQWIAKTEQTLNELAQLLQGGRDEVSAKTQQLLERNRLLEKELSDAKAQLMSAKSADLLAQAQEVDGIKVLATRLDGVDAKAMRDAVDQFKQRLGTSVVVFGAAEGGKVRLVAGVSKDACQKLPAGSLIKDVAALVGGQGGGRADMAQAGGTDPSRLDEALATVAPWVRAHMMPPKANTN